MSDTKAERLAGALNEFINTSPDVEAAAVVSFDGLTMASALPDGMDDDRLGAMSAALLSLAEQAARGLGRGDLRQLFVEGDHGFVFLMSAKDQAVLVAVTDRTAKIGFILYEMRRAAEEVGGVLEARASQEDGSWLDALELVESAPEPGTVQSGTTAAPSETTAAQPAAGTAQSGYGAGHSGYGAGQSGSNGAHSTSALGDDAPYYARASAPAGPAPADGLN